MDQKTAIQNKIAELRKVQHVHIEYCQVTDDTRVLLSESDPKEITPEVFEAWQRLSIKAMNRSIEAVTLVRVQVEGLIEFLTSELNNLDSQDGSSGAE